MKRNKQKRIGKNGTMFLAKEALSSYQLPSHGAVCCAKHLAASDKERTPKRKIFRVLHWCTMVQFLRMMINTSGVHTSLTAQHTERLPWCTGLNIDNQPSSVILYIGSVVLKFEVRPDAHSSGHPGCVVVWKLFYLLQWVDHVHTPSIHHQYQYTMHTASKPSLHHQYTIHNINTASTHHQFIINTPSKHHPYTNNTPSTPS